MTEKKSLNFIEQIIEEDLANGMPKKDLRFRFPPEPNGYLHIGHAASICLNFGLGEKYNAPVNLRFDDTNPAKEEQEYVDAIKRDVAWLGFQWDKELYSSDYFQQLYDWAIQLIKDGKAYVDLQSSEEIAAQKGTPTEPGVAGPYRDTSPDENLALFLKMKNGEFEEGQAILRAKIDMAHNNMHMRDPIMYRILKKAHHRTGNDWVIYPMYDWTHGESDYLEQITHSLCTLEFKSHRDLYEWYLEQVYNQKNIKPKQREFARRNISYTVMSKRKLLQLVNEGHVAGWDDPRMPTISGLRRRGYTPNSIKKFSEVAGISKRDNVTDVALLEFCIKDELNKTAPRVMAVLDPVKLVIDNYPQDMEEILIAENNPEDEQAGTREVPFAKELYIEREDFREQANKKFFRLKLGGEVRLKNAYIIKADTVEKDEHGNITVIHCTADLDSRSGSGTEASKRRVKGTIHWVSSKHALQAEVRLYDRLFKDEAPDSHKDIDFKEFINSNSLQTITALVEPSLQVSQPGDRFQFQRKGYFCADVDSTSNQLIFNRTVGLTDSWAKQEQKKQAPTSDTNYDAILPLAAKYLKARSNEDRATLLATIEPLAKQVNLDVLSKKLSEAIANKDVLAGLLTLKFLGIDTDEQHAFLGKALDMKNGAIKLEAINLTIADKNLLSKNRIQLESLLADEKSPFIKELLENALA
ncbi:glutamine--tRNA ligase/YqeY domain fusion protein [Ochrovirga pacifica]|uniref:glutamine--tRNA ligase/YqeY domain fusion protein n=1 Tax=Ochrovirga pacifica TaxID=1042376 RepID=UPI000255A843|nr:glutamine--tRNA ligase/YqeY domain fusion protein [Ochrovirga pacifica]